MTEVSPPSEHDAQQSAWGAPPAGAQWSTKKTLAAVGIAAVLAVGGAAAIHAADGGSAGNAGPGFGGPPGGPGRGGPGFGGPGGPDSGSANLPTALHGEFVVSDGHGGYTTELTQTGTVTELSDTSITARSEDGYTQTYVINTDTRMGRNPLTTGETATIRAVEADGTPTASAISPSR